MLIKRCLPIILLIILVITAVPQSSPFAESQNNLVAVRIPRKDTTDFFKITPSPQTYILYDSFVWAIISEDQLVSLEDAHIPYVLVKDVFTLNLGNITFDPLIELPDIKTTTNLNLNKIDEDLQLIQFFGPTKDIWLNDLEQSGLEIVQYIYPFTYIVWGSTGSLSEAAQRENVRWARSFSPAFRYSKEAVKAEIGNIQARIMLYRGADIDSLITQIEASGGLLIDRSVMDRKFEVASFQLDTSLFEKVATLPGVYSIQPVPTDGGTRGEMSNQLSAGKYAPSGYVYSGYKNWLDQVGLTGDGVIIANVDSGIDDNHPDLINRIFPCTGTTCGGMVESNHGSHTAGIMAGDASSGIQDVNGFFRGLGVSPGANLIEQLYSPTYTYTNGMLILMQESINNGASISGNSWGPSASARGYDLDTRLVDIGVRDADPGTPGDQPLSYVLSIMNGYGGTSSQGTPDEAKNIFTIGSTYMQLSNRNQRLNFDDLSYNTAHGPALDGRLIPHLVAPGYSVDSTGIGRYLTMGGTSMASPHVSGAAALFIEKYRNLFSVDPSPALIKAAFLPVANDLAGNLDADGNTLMHPFDAKQGWGRLNTAAVLDPQGEVFYYDAPVLFDNTGETWQVNISLPYIDKPLRIMLVWTDAPGHGLGGETPAWNNNLDLSLTMQDQIFFGNQFDSNSGWSVISNTSDNMNNTEGIFIQHPTSSSVTITVTAANINSDGVPSSGDGTDQDFALVIYNVNYPYQNFQYIFPLVFR
jgi:hypothetical protein